MTETYSVITNFNNKLNSSQLQSEINANISITKKVVRIDIIGDVVDIVFQSTISAGEKIILDNIVSAHMPKTNEVQIVKIKEETNDTGENFQITSIKINAAKNTTTSTYISWPHPISALLLNFTSGSEHIGDFISLSAIDNTIVGVITANVTPATTWTAQNYTTGQSVTYDTGDEIFGIRTYTCVANTVNNEVPTNKIYWQYGMRLGVSQTVSDNVMVGYYIKLTNGVNTNDFGRVIKVDKNNHCIYVENNAVNSFAAASPTYVLLTVYAIKDYEIGKPWSYDIGQGKIGGSYIPADTKIHISYTNLSATDDKVLYGSIELLY